MWISSSEFELRNLDFVRWTYPDENLPAELAGSVVPAGARV
jgi:hypothetical protein